MGNRPTATLAFGYAFDESGCPWLIEDHWKDEIRCDWEFLDYYIERVLKKDPTKFTGYTKRCKIEEQMPVVAGSWGYLDDPCFFIYPNVKGACISNNWDGVRKLGVDEAILAQDAQHFNVWEKTLKDFCKDMDMDMKGQEPTWILLASYG